MNKMPARKMPEGFDFLKTKKPITKVQGAKVGVKKPIAKTLTGPAAIAELQRQVSPRGTNKAEANAKKAIDKKYPGLYKKSK